MSQNTGRVFITVAGRRLKSKEGAKIHIGGIERTGETGDSGVLGYTERETLPYVECVIKHDGKTSLREFQAMTDVTISADTDSGRSYIYRNAWYAKGHELDKGEVALRFEAMSCEEV